MTTTTIDQTKLNDLLGQSDVVGNGRHDAGGGGAARYGRRRRCSRRPACSKQTSDRVHVDDHIVTSDEHVCAASGLQQPGQNRGRARAAGELDDVGGAGHISSAKRSARRMKNRMPK